MPKLTYLIINQLRRSIRRKHTLPNYKIRFKPFFELLYNEKLYKSNVQEFLHKQQKKQENGPKDKPSKHADCPEYEKFSRLIGNDLTSIGQLNVSLKTCDRLPEALYTLNYQAQNPKLQTLDAPALQKSASSTQLPSQASPSEQCFIYITTSIDQHSMRQLMDKRIIRENWPFIEFEIQKTSVNQSIGINFMEVFFNNKNEICIQKILPDSLASKVRGIKPFDILYSINQVPCSSIKTLNKLMTKFGLQPLKFVVQRPSVLSTKRSVRVSNYPTRISSAIDEESKDAAKIGANNDTDSLNSQIIQNDINTQNVSASSLVDFYCNVSECPFVSSKRAFFSSNLPSVQKIENFAYFPILSA
jgi:hypothetical protein